MKMKKDEMIMIIGETLEKREDIESYEIRNVEKAGFSYTGMALLFKDMYGGPVFNLDSMYQKVLSENLSEDEVRTMISDALDSMRDCMPVDLGKFTDKDYILENLFFRVVRTEGNEEFLSMVPHMEVSDMSIYLKSGNYTSNTAVTHGLAEEMGLEQENLFRIAMENCEKNSPLKIAPMENLISEIIGEGVEVPDYGPKMLVVSDSNQLSGAGVIFYKDALKKVSDAMGGKDFYLLPSSIWEFIAVEDLDEEDSEDAVSRLVMMVHEVNGTLEKGDILTDSVYRYDKETNSLVLSGTYKSEIEIYE